MLPCYNFSMMKKQALFLLIFSYLIPLFALPTKSPHPDSEIMHLNGKKLRRRDDFFRVVGIKVDDAGKKLTISIFFSDPIDTNTVACKKILVQEKFLPSDTRFLFSKNRQMLRFSLDKIFFHPTLQKENDLFSLKIFGLRAFDLRPLHNFETKSLKPGSFLKLPPKNKDKAEQACQIF